MSKICSKCHIEKDESGFSKNKTNKDGYAYYCKKCMTTLVVAWQKKNKEPTLKANRKYQKKIPKGEA